MSCVHAFHPYVNTDSLVLIKSFIRDYIFALTLKKKTDGRLGERHPLELLPGRNAWKHDILVPSKQRERPGTDEYSSAGSSTKPGVSC